MHDTTGQHRLYSCTEQKLSTVTVYAAYKVPLHYIWFLQADSRLVHLQVHCAVKQEAGGRDQFLRHNQVKRSMPSRMKWTGSGISFNVNMTEKPPVRSDVWSCVYYVADARAMNVRQFLLSYVSTYRNKIMYIAYFLCKYLVCGNNRSYSYRKTPSLVKVYAPDEKWSAGSSDLQYLTANENFTTHKNFTH